NWAASESSIRVLVLSGNGKHFTAGIDFSLVQSLFLDVAKEPEGRKQEALFERIVALQRAFTAFEKCSKPVIAAIHGYCIGGGIDLITACDLRYAAAGSTFCVKEIDLGIVADIGTLQRLPPIIGEGRARELSFTARMFHAEEAHQIGLLNGIYDNYEAMMAGVQSVAETLAAKSPLTMRGLKRICNYSREHSTQDSLHYVATWNAAMLLSKDTQEAFQAILQKRDPQFDD
ncbi:MAG: crotonase/enoyl-CoA hydratase family protein, partial [Myxococcota bacterium]|nr:crotonase/enoyl-CoA hydratase family protein [Myxococcota bacterium]